MLPEPILTAPFPGIDAYYAPLREWLVRTREQMEVELRESELRGRGGAGFPVRSQVAILPGRHRAR